MKLTAIFTLIKAKIQGRYILIGPHPVIVFVVLVRIGAFNELDCEKVALLRVHGGTALSPHSKKVQGLKPPGCFECACWTFSGCCSSSTCTVVSVRK